MEPCSTTDDAEYVLRHIFKHAAWRENQEEICKAIIAKRDVIVISPTGSGKSLLFQVPALVQRGTTIVVSPLISLMSDQVAKLVNLDVPAAALHSGQSPRETDAIYHELSKADCVLKLLYVTPEAVDRSTRLSLALNRMQSEVSQEPCALVTYSILTVHRTGSHRSSLMKHIAFQCGGTISDQHTSMDSSKCGEDGQASKSLP